MKAILEPQQLLAIVTAIVLNGHPQRSPKESLEIAKEIMTRTGNPK